MKMSVDVILSDAELQECIELGRSRNRAKRDTQFRHARQSAEDVHIQGIVAEAAVAKLFGVEFSREIWSRGDRHKPDLELMGVTFEVKCPFYRPAILKMDDEREFGADAAILAERPKPNVVRIVGYISKEEFREVHTLRDFGYGQRMVISDHSKLRPITELLEML